MYLHSNYDKFYAQIATKFDEIGFNSIANFAYYETAEELKNDLLTATNLVTAIEFIVEFEDGYVLSKDKSDNYSVYHPFEYLKILFADALDKDALMITVKDAVGLFENLTPAVSNVKFPAEIEAIYQELKTNLNALAVYQLDGYDVLDETGKVVGDVVFNKTLFVNWGADENNISYQNVTYDFNFQLELNKILVAKNYSFNK